MSKRKNNLRHRLGVLTLVLSMSALFVSSVVIIPPSRSFAQSSQPSATPVDIEAFRRAAAEAIAELRAAKAYIAALEVEVKVAKEIDDLEAQLVVLLKNLRNLDAQQIVELNKALAAKDRVIAAYEAEIVVLKKSRMTPWKKVKWLVIGGAAGAAICAFVCK